MDRAYEYGARIKGVSCSISNVDFHFEYSINGSSLASPEQIGLFEPAAFFPSPNGKWTNRKMENGKCLRLRYNARGVSASESEALPAFIFCGELMFERYTEKARRVIFFARYEASQFGAPAIEPEHLLLGLMREDKTLAGRFFPRAQITIESIRREIEGRTILRERIPTSVELPLAPETKRVLHFSHDESDRLQHRHIGT